MKNILFFFFTLLFIVESKAQVTPDATIHSNVNTQIRLASPVLRINHANIEDVIVNSKLSRIEYIATSSGTATYAVTIPWFTTYTSGVWFPIVFSNGNTGASTLNINTVGAKNLVHVDGSAMATGDIKAGGAYTAFYDGTNIQLTGSGLLSISGIAAGGDLSGTYPNPTVSKILNNTIPANASGVLTNNGSGTLTWGSAGTTYTADETSLHLASTVFSIKSTYIGQSSITTLGTIGTGSYQATPIADSYISSAATWNAKQPAGNYITALTGDATASGPGSVALTLATVNTNTGSWGTATQSPQFTVNGKGLITAAANITITPAIGSITGLGTGISTWLTTPTSSNLASAVTDETGSGSLVFATSPTFITPILGTPTSGVATNLTGTASGLTAGNVTTNANLTGPITSVGNATSITSQTGTGTTFVMQASPAFTGTPTLGTLGYSDTGILMSIQSSTNSYNQFIVQNTNAGATASTSVIISNDQGTATTKYGEFTMNSSGFTGSGSFNLPNAVQLDAITDDLVIGTLANKSLHLVVNNSITDALTIAGSGLITENGTWTATANNQYHHSSTTTQTARATASDVMGGWVLAPKLIATSTSQTLVGLTIDNSNYVVGIIGTLSATLITNTTAGCTNNTYTNVSANTTTNTVGNGATGSGALFTVVVSGNIVTSITLTNGGSGYSLSDNFTFNGSAFGGSGSVQIQVLTIIGINLGTRASALSLKIYNSPVWGQAVGRFIDFQTTGTGGSYGSIENNTFGGLTHNDAGGIIFSTTGSSNTLTFRNAITVSMGTLSLGTSLQVPLLSLGGNNSGGAISNVNLGSVTGSAQIRLGANNISYNLLNDNTSYGLINQITAGSITAAGSGYISATYTNVPLTGGSGTTATATIVVTGGAVTSVTFPSASQRGKNYKSTDVLSASNTNLGGSGSGFTWTISQIDYTGDIFTTVRSTSWTHIDNGTANKYITVYNDGTINQLAGATGYYAFGEYTPTLTSVINAYGLLIRPALPNSFALGATNPTAWVHIGAGTTTNAPARFTSGPLTTGGNIAAGQFQFLTDDWYATITTGTAVHKIGRVLTNTATLDFGSTLAGTATDLTITVTGAVSGDAVAVGVPNGSTLSDGSFTGWVSSADTVTIRFTNNSLTLTLDPASGTFKATVIKN